MFVDLGYNGTVQNLIEPVLRRTLRPHRRRPLPAAARGTSRPGFDKKGLIDDRHYDLDRVIHALCGPIAVVEQILHRRPGLGGRLRARRCADPQGRRTSRAQQNAIRDRIQEACVAFARACGMAASSGRPRRTMPTPAAAWPARVLARLLFMPTARRGRGASRTFDHDVNLGTDDMVQLLDAESVRDGLRRRGLFYLNRVPPDVPAGRAAAARPAAQPGLVQRATAIGPSVRSSPTGNSPLLACGRQALQKKPGARGPRAGLILSPPEVKLLSGAGSARPAGSGWPGRASPSTPGSGSEPWRGWSSRPRSRRPRSASARRDRLVTLLVRLLTDRLEAALAGAERGAGRVDRGQRGRRRRSSAVPALATVSTEVGAEVVDTSRPVTRRPCRSPELAPVWIDVDGRVGRREAEQRDAVELGVGEDVVDLRLQLGDFGLQVGAVVVRVGAAARTAPPARGCAAACW